MGERLPEQHPVAAVHLGLHTGVEGLGTFVEIEAFLDRKIDALGCYRNVMRSFPHSRSQEALRGLAAYRGAQCGLGLAEAFQSIFKTALD